MLGKPTLEAARRWFSEDIREVSPVVHDDRVVEAFATVPREQYLGEGPWDIHSRLIGGAVHKSATSDPRHIYHDVLVSIDVASGINNGLPSLWALVFDNLKIAPGATVLQVGAGTGYYTAILAELVGLQGAVIAYEIEAHLARRAASNLQHYAQVGIISGDAVRAADLPKLDVVVACAGVTHIPARWLAQLSEAGRMMVPLTGTDGWGILMHLTRNGKDLPVKSLGPCGFYPCHGARLKGEAKAISKALKSQGSSEPAIKCYHLGTPPGAAEGAWLPGKDYWISEQETGDLPASKS